MSDLEKKMGDAFAKAIQDRAPFSYILPIFSLGLKGPYVKIGVTFAVGGQ